MTSGSAKTVQYPTETSDKRMPRLKPGCDLELSMGSSWRGLLRYLRYSSKTPRRITSPRDLIKRNAAKDVNNVHQCLTRFPSSVQIIIHHLPTVNRVAYLESVYVNTGITVCAENPHEDH
jgi:hypothetical protein